MIRVILLGAGVILTLVARGLIWEGIGLCLVIFPLLFDPSKKKLRKVE